MAKKLRRELKANVRKTLQKQAEKLWKEYCKKRDGYKCRLCSSTHILQVHHVFSRGKTRIFIDVDNGFTLCRDCHMSATHNDTTKDTIRRKIDPAKYDRIYEQSLITGAFLEWKSIEWLERQITILNEITEELP